MPYFQGISASTSSENFVFHLGPKNGRLPCGKAAIQEALGCLSDPIHGKSINYEILNEGDAPHPAIIRISAADEAEARRRFRTANVDWLRQR